MELKELIALYSANRDNQDLLQFIEDVDLNSAKANEAVDLWDISMAVKTSGCEASFIDARSTYSKHACIVQSLAFRIINESLKDVDDDAIVIAANFACLHHRLVMVHMKVAGEVNALSNHSQICARIKPSSSLKGEMLQKYSNAYWIYEALLPGYLGSLLQFDTEKAFEGSKQLRSSQQGEFIGELIGQAKFQMRMGDRDLAGDWLWELLQWRPGALENNREQFIKVHRMFLATRTSLAADQYLMSDA